MEKIKWKIFFILLKLYWPLQKMHNFFISSIKENNQTKVFCIGTYKTGTTSLHKALKILGYKSPRLFAWPVFWKYGDKSYIKELKKTNYNAFVDFPFGHNEFVDFPLGHNDLYKKIDVSIPGSKFILTIRDSECLKKSRFNFYKNSPWSSIMTDNLSEKIKHISERNDEIISYFKNRKSQLLVMDITKGDGWDKLCNFLNKSIPNKPFPHKNRGKYK